jgi:hypothetical protein
LDWTTWILSILAWGGIAYAYFRRRKTPTSERIPKFTGQTDFTPPVPDEIQFANVLGLKGKVRKEEIKKKYRELVHKYHPDKVSHLGVEFQEVAHGKIREINDAYAYFRKKYKIE